VPVTINAGGVLTGSDTADGGVGASAHIRGLLTLNGGTLANGGTGAQPQWGTWNLDDGVVVNGGTNTSTMSALDMIPTQAGATIFSVTNGGTASGVDLDVTGTLINGTASPDTGIILNGNGTMVLSGANTYAGTTTVNNGTLRLDGSLATGAVAVNGGAFGGTGTANGAVTVNAGGKLTPGTAAVGTLSVNNNLTLAGNVLIKLNKGLAPAQSNDGQCLRHADLWRHADGDEHRLRSGCGRHLPRFQSGRHGQRERFSQRRQRAGVQLRGRRGERGRWTGRSGHDHQQHQRKFVAPGVAGRSGLET
jgi:autotransporter-associated beta strand protein